MPFIGASALAMATIRPGTRGAVGGRKPSSTPSGITRTRLGSTPKSVTMSRWDDADGVSTRRAFRATLVCILRKPYQRRSVSRLRQVVAAARSRRRSTVIGWWMVVTSGSPSPSIASMPVASTWLSCTTSKSPTRSRSSRTTRVPNVFGSGNPAVHIVRNSSTSTRSRNSPQARHPERVGLAVEVQAGHLGQPDAGVELGVRLPGEHLDVVPERDQLAAEVPDVDALAAAVRLAAVGQQGDPQRPAR